MQCGSGRVCAAAGCVMRCDDGDDELRWPDACGPAGRQWFLRFNFFPCGRYDLASRVNQLYSVVGPPTRENIQFSRLSGTYGQILHSEKSSWSHVKNAFHRDSWTTFYMSGIQLLYHIEIVKLCCLFWVSNKVDDTIKTWKRKIIICMRNKGNYSCLH